MGEKPAFIVVDLETTGLDWKKEEIHGIAWSMEEDEAQYDSLRDAANGELFSLVGDPTVAVVGHNLRFDLRFLAKAGFVARGPLYDTMLMAQLVNENCSLGLKELSQKLLGDWSIESKRELDRVLAQAGCKHVGELCAKDLADPSRPYLETISRYAKEDVNNTYKLFLELGRILSEQDANWRALGVSRTPLDYFNEEGSAVEHALLSMELRGIRLNPERVHQAQVHTLMDFKKLEENLSERFKEPISAIEDQLYDTALSKRKSEKGKAKVQRSSEDYETRFNWGSSAHLGRLVYEHFAVPDRCVRRTKSGLYSTADGDLASLKAECKHLEPLQSLLEGISEHRRLAKLLNTYVNSDSSLLAGAHNGRVYSTYLQAGSSKEGGKGGTATGRLSSQGPNMQNLPRGGAVKGFFVPDEGHVFVYADYSQVELRIAAHVSQDPELLGAYQKNLDLHAGTASAVFGKPVSAISKEERQVAKMLNFAMIYDASAYRLFQELGKEGYSLEDCEDMRKAFFERFRVYKNYLRSQLLYMREMLAVRSETGRVRRLPEMAIEPWINWRAKKLVGPKGQQPPKEVTEMLLYNPKEYPSDAELFNRARKKVKHAVKQGYNFPIQSLGASIAKRSMVRLLNSGFDLVTQVHDSIVVQVKSEEAKDRSRFMQRIMEETYKLSVPLVAETKLLASLDESEVLGAAKSDPTDLTKCGKSDIISVIVAKSN